MMRQSIEAWIYHPEGGEILLLKVEDEKVSFWQPITGGIESGESPEEACLREIKEETGLLLDCSNLTSLGDFMVKIDENLTIHKKSLSSSDRTEGNPISDEHSGSSVDSFRQSFVAVVLAQQSGDF